MTENTATTAAPPRVASDGAARVLPNVTWRDIWIGSLAALATVMMWASWPVVTRYGVTGALDPLAIGILRFLPPVLILSPVLWRVGLFPKMTPLVWAGLLCGGYPFFVGATEGFLFASVANCVVVSSGLIPLLVAGLSYLLFGVRVDPVRRIGLGFIVAAILIAIGQGLLLADSHIWIGQLLFAISGVSFALYTIAFPFSGLTGMQATAVVGFWSLMVALPLGAPGLVDAVQKGLWAEIGLQVMQQGVFSALLSFLTYNAAVRRLGPGRAATVIALAPVLASIFAYIVLGEVPVWPLAIALILTAIGVALASRMTPRKG